MLCRLRPKRWIPPRALVFAAVLPTACSSSTSSSTSSTSDANESPNDVTTGIPTPDTTIELEDSSSFDGDVAEGEPVEVRDGDPVPDISEAELEVGGADTCEGLECQPVTGGAVCPPAAPYGIEVGETMPDLVLKSCDDGEISLHTLCEKEAVWLFGYADW